MAAHLLVHSLFCGVHPHVCFWGQIRQAAAIAAASAIAAVNAGGLHVAICINGSLEGCFDEGGECCYPTLPLTLSHELLADEPAHSTGSIASRISTGSAVGNLDTRCSFCRAVTEQQKLSAAKVLCSRSD